MKTKTIFVILLVLFCIYGLNAQQKVCETCGEPYDCAPTHDTLIIRDTVRIYISDLEAVTQHFGLSFDEYVKQYLTFAKTRDTIKAPSSTTVYLNYFLPLLKNNQYTESKRWITDVFTIYAKQNSFNTEQKSISLPDSIEFNKISTDLLIVCEGSESTDFLLTSPQLIDSCLVELFQYIYEKNINSTQIKGLNFYFPKFLFKEKRAMAQFAKSVSLIIDRSILNPIHPIKLYFSFNKVDGEANLNYLYGIASMVDSIFLIDQTDATKVFSNYSVIDKNSNTISFYHKLINQFYLARFADGDIPMSKNYFNSVDIIDIAHSDYPENDWELYFILLCSILTIALIILILYWFFPIFSYYLNKNIDYMQMLALILLVESLLLLFIMFEAMSRDSIFDFSDKNRYFILLFPIILILFAPLIKLIRPLKEKA